jgi:hypothetical protein
MGASRGKPDRFVGLVSVAGVAGRDGLSAVDPPARPVRVGRAIPSERASRAIGIVDAVGRVGAAVAASTWPSASPMARLWSSSTRFGPPVRGALAALQPPIDEPRTS